MGYVDNSDHMAYSYSMSRRTFKWTTKFFFHFLDVTVLNTWTLLSSRGAKYTHRDFKLLLVSNLRKLERAKISPPPDWLEDRVLVQKMFCDSSVAISTGQRNLLPNSAAACVLLAAKEIAQSIGAPDVTWACVWCLVSRNITQK
jgi:hypothetical protein